MVPPPFGVAVTPGRGGLRGLAEQCKAVVMDDPEQLASLGELNERLAVARKRRDAGRAPKGGVLSSQGASAGFRIAVEILAALVVGTLFGFFLDRWLGTKPWLMIVLFFVGSGAALRNVIRTANQLEAERKRIRDAGKTGPKG